MIKIEYIKPNFKKIIAPFSIIETLLKKDPFLKKKIILSFFLVLLGTIIGIILPIFFKFIIDVFSNSPQKLNNSILLVIIGYGTLILLNAIIGPLRELISFSVAESIINRLHLKFFNKLVNFDNSFNNILENHGSALNILERTQRAILSFFCDILYFVVPAIIEIFFAILILAFLYPFKYAFILLVTSIIYVGIVINTAKSSLLFQKQENNIRDKCSNFLINVLDNWEIIKYSNTAKKHNLDYSKLLNNKNKIIEKSLFFQYSRKIMESLVIAIGTVISIIIGIKDVNDNQLTIGGLTLIFSYTTQFFFPLKFLGLIFFNIQKNLLSLNELLDIINKPDSENSANYPNILVQNNKKIPEIEFKDVEFNYETKCDFSLSSINFTAIKGEKIAIIGRSGSGKSTLCKLILNKSQLNHGNIFLKSMNISEISREFIASSISVTPQNITMFHNSILYNLRYFNENASLEKVKELCNSLGILDYINSLPQKFDTQIQSYNNLFSVGQMQLLGIARCILKDASLYIFDEPTSALDPLSEQAILNSISYYLKNKTIFYITHNIEVGQKFDKILVLENGNIKEIGSYDELIKNQALYYHLLKIKEDRIWQDRI